MSLVAAIMAYAGSKKRTGNLFSYGEGLSLDRIRKLAQEALKGVENIYTQHKPFLHELITEILGGRLSASEFPFLTGQASRDPPKNLIVFIVGGVTYEEALCVSEFNSTSSSVDSKAYANPTRTKIVLGGNTVLNSAAFLNELRLVSI